MMSGEVVSILLKFDKKKELKQLKEHEKREKEITKRFEDSMIRLSNLI